MERGVGIFKHIIAVFALFLFLLSPLSVSGQEPEIFPQSVRQVYSNNAAFGSGPVLAAAFQDDSGYGVRFWDAAEGRVSGNIRGHGGPVSFTGFTPGGEKIITASQDHVIRIWNSGSSKPLHEIKLDEYLVFHPVALSSDGTSMAFAVNPRGFGSFDISGGEGRNFFASELVLSLAYSPDGKRLVSGHGGSLIVWDALSGKRLQTFPANPVYSVTYSPDGRRIAAAAGTGIRIWDAGSGRDMRSLNGDGSSTARYVRYSPDGRRIAASFGDTGGRGLVKLFEASGRELFSVELSSAALTLSFDQRGNRLAAACEDGTVRLIDAADGSEIVRFISYEDGEWICISPAAYYNASPRGDGYLNALVDDEVYGIDRFRKTFYRPDLIKALLEGRDIKAAGIFAPPEIIIAAGGLTRGIALVNPEKAESRFSFSVTINDRSKTLKDIRILQNGRRLGETDFRQFSGSRGLAVLDAGLTLLESAESVEFTLPLTLDPGTNVIEVIASNAYAEERKSFEVKGAAGGAEKEKPRLWILAIGVNAYDHGNIPDLNYCVNDAVEIIAAFKRQQGSVYEEVNSLLVADGMTLPPTAKNIQESLRFLSRAGSNDIVLLFLAGHGVSDADGSFLFLPRDAAFNGDGSVVPGAALAAADIFSVLNNSGSRLVFIDACHSGGLSGKTNAVDNDRLIRSLIESNAFVFTSSRGNELSQERAAYEHGVFTYGILRGLQGVRNGETLSMMQLSAFVTRLVKEITGDEQHPSPYTLGFDDFTVADSRQESAGP
jgi:hypothetical protein